MFSILKKNFRKKKEILKEKILKQIKYLIFIVFSILMLKNYTKNKLNNNEIVVIVISLTGCYILLEAISPTQKILC